MKYLSLFSGIGGFELGLQNSKYDFECIGFSEIDDYAKQIYTRWFPRHRDLGDASKIDTSELQDFELLVGGFPCQAFSLAGYRQGFDDTRGTLFFEIARILADKKPRYFLLENVFGLLSHSKGETFKRMLGIFAELGYDVEWQTFNSKDFGTAQSRERLYIKGYFRAKCGREILSVRRSGSKTDVPGSVSPKAFKFNRQVKKRVHSVDYKELSQFLRDAKKSAKVSVAQISEKLGKPQTEVEHWFRTDDFFAPPTDDIWFDLKGLLGIESDTYDAFITEFEWVDGVYEIDKRAYEIDGLSPTLTTTETLAKINIVGNLSDTGHHGDDIMGTDGLSTSMTASNHKHPLRIIETDDIMDSSLNCKTNENNISLLKLKTNTNLGYDEVTKGDGVRLCHPSSTKARGRTQKGLTGALSTSADWGTVDKDYRIRRLTPRECERLQAFPDDWTRFGANGEEISETQRYKTLGNAVTTTVVTWIVDNWLFGESDE